MYSLGEIEAQCKKASRGAGLSWGMADEAAISARLLTEAGLPGAQATLFNIRALSSNNMTLLEFKVLQSKIGSKPYSGLLLGVSFLDSLGLLPDMIKFKTCSLIGPLAFVGILLQLRDDFFSFRVIWDGCQISMDHTGLKIKGNNLNPEKTSEVFLQFSRTQKKALMELKMIPKISEKCWTELSTWAQLTHVAESQKSRLYGAGGGTSDSD